jgi:hypothetical protein
MKFKLLAGRHSEGGKLYDATGRTRPIIESERDLEAIFGREHFLRLPEDGSPVMEEEPEVLRPSNHKKPPPPPPDPDEGKEITLQAVRRGRGRYDVVKVVDGEPTDDCVNEEFLTRAQAEKMVEAGWQK